MTRQPPVALGLDIGGANLKAATSEGAAGSEPFEIWRAPGDLTARLQQLIARFPPADLLAVTMTAELADWLDVQHKRNLVLTFGGGVNEVQRELIATAGLGLPRVPR